MSCKGLLVTSSILSGGSGLYWLIPPRSTLVIGGWTVKGGRVSFDQSQTLLLCRHMDSWPDFEAPTHAGICFEFWGMCWNRILWIQWSLLNKNAKQKQ